MKDQELRKILREGGVIYKCGDVYKGDACKNFNKLWDIASRNRETLRLLIDHLGLEFDDEPRIAKKEENAD